MSASVEIRKRPRAVIMRQQTVTIAEDPLVVRGSGQLSFTRPDRSDPDEATLLLFDRKLSAYRPVLTPPGTSWELVEKRQGATLWRPGMPTT